MIAKIAVIFGLIAAAQGGLYGTTALGYAGGIGYGSHGYGSTYGVSPYSNYVTPIVKTIAPVYTAPIAYAPAISTVSQYSIHETPAYASYVSPHSYGYSPAVSYSNYRSYGYNGYGGKYAW